MYTWQSAKLVNTKDIDNRQKLQSEAIAGQQCLDSLTSALMFAWTFESTGKTERISTK